MSDPESSRRSGSTGRRYVVNLDLKYYFPTITENRVEGMLTSLNLDSRVATVIARICCMNNHLPQGAPSSPVLSNMICFRLDKRLMNIAKGARCIYTRYADDITFSSHQPPSPLFEAGPPSPGRFAPELLAPDLRDAITNNGFAFTRTRRIMPTDTRGGSLRGSRSTKS